MASLHSTVGDFAVDDWDRLADDNPFATHGWLSTIESCSRALVQPMYFAIRRDDALCAAAACYVAHGNPSVETLDDLLLGRVRRVANRLGVTFLPSLVCSPAQGYGWHVAVDPRLKTADRRAMRAALLDAIEGEAGRRDLPLSFTQVLDTEATMATTLQERGYAFADNVPIAFLDVRWSSIDDYFQQLPGKQRRESRRERRRNIKEGTRIDILHSCQGEEARLFALLEANAARHAALRFPFSSDLLPVLMRNMGAHAVVFVARKQGRISGVQLVLRRGTTAVAFAVAVDEEIGGDDFSHFELGYYHLIEYAIENGIERIYFGRGMYDAKVRRGCQLMGSRIYMRSPGVQQVKFAMWSPIASWWNRRKQDA